MPRNSIGNYTLPAGNPVAPATLIETAWANPTLADLAAALTDSLDRYGRGGMLAAFTVADGTVSAPGVAFVAQSNTGMFRPATSELGFTVNSTHALSILPTGIDFKVPGMSSQGVPIANLDPTGIDFLVPVNLGGGAIIPEMFLLDGTALEPSLSFLGAVDMGLFREPVSDSLGFATAGVERMRIGATGTMLIAGSVGIGIAPATKLHVEGSLATSSGASSLSIYPDAAGGPSLQWFGGIGDWRATLNAAADTWSILRNSTERLHIAAAGNVGIGLVPNASIKLDVGGYIAARGPTATVRIEDTTAGKAFGLQSISSGLRVFDYNVGAERMRVATDGVITFGTLATASFTFYSNYMLIKDGVGSVGYAGAGTLLSGGVASDFVLRSDSAMTFGTGGGNLRMKISAAGVITDGPGYELGYKDVPLGALAGVDVHTGTRGMCIPITTNAVLASGWAYQAGQVYSLFNNTAGTLTLSGSGITIWLAGTALTGTRNLAARAMCTVWMLAPTIAVVSGPGVS